MTLPSQFSLEEENFYKDIQDLVKKGSQNEKELSSFLQRYMDLLARADLDDETFIINFTKAGLIIEASAKVYGTKVDRLWINLEHVLESLKNKNQNCKKKTDCDEDGVDEDLGPGADDPNEDGKRKLPNCGRRKKKQGDSLFYPDDFIEIDNKTGLLDKNVNEGKSTNEFKLKLCETVPNMFIKNKTKKKKIDFCLNKCLEDKDVIRLRDWIISPDGLLVKEMYTSLPINDFSNSVTENENYVESESYKDDEMEVCVNLEENLMEENDEVSNEFKYEKNNNTDLDINLEGSIKEQAVGEEICEAKDKFLDVSKESDLAKFPNVLDRLSEDCLVDVDEVFWNASKFQDVIPSKKMRAGKTNKLPCQLCADKKSHKKKGRKCLEEKRLGSLDSFFTPHVQSTLSEPHFGILPDEELFNAFKMEMKVIEHLGKMNNCKNVNEAYHPDERPEELKNFLGFDGFENYLMKKTADFYDEDEMGEENLMLDALEDDNDNFHDDPVPEKEFELPFPVTESSVKTNFLQDKDTEGEGDDFLENPDLEYQKLVIEELKDHYASKTSFAKNKELGIKISKWHELIADKIKLSEKRGALNMNVLADKIMKSFPNEEKPVMDFRDLVRKKSRRDVPRYFFACLQLTNEGNLDIGKSNPKSLVTDCVILTRLRTTRSNCELEESSKSPSKVSNSSKVSKAENKRKRNSFSRSPPMKNSENFHKKSKKEVKYNKRPKDLNFKTNSKRRRCSVSSGDSFLSE